MPPFNDKLPLTPESQRLVMSCQGLVRTIAWKIHRKVSRHIELDDLISYGQVGLVEAARRFDLSRGLEFTTFAYHRVRGAILDGLSRMSWFKEVDYARGRYEVTANEVMQTEESHGADVEALTDSATRLGVIHLFCNYSEERIDAVEDSDPSDLASRNELRTRLVELLTTLDTEARDLIHAVYFEGLTLEQAGARAGFTKSWASRAHARAIRTLAKNLCSSEPVAVKSSSV